MTAETDNQDFVLFGDEAQDAWRRRDRAFFAAQNRRPLELAWSVLVTLAGLYLLNFSAASLWAFLLLSQWGGVLRNTAKLAIARAPVKRGYGYRVSDGRVWAQVTASMRGRPRSEARIPVDGRWSPLGLLILDYVALSIVTAIILGIAAERDIRLLEALSNDSRLLWITTATLTAQVLVPLFSDLSGRPGQGRIMAYDAGGAIIVGFVLTGIFAGLADGEAGLRTSLLAVNAFLVLGIPLAIVAARMYRQQTHWLKRQLDLRDAHYSSLE